MQIGINRKTEKEKGRQEDRTKRDMYKWGETYKDWNRGMQKDRKMKRYKWRRTEKTKKIEIGKTIKDKNREI
jgi:hypothetical protein